MLTILSGNKPIFIIVSRWLGVAPPMMVLPKPNNVAERRTIGIGIGSALPLRLTTPALLLVALLAIFSVAALELISPEGAKLTARLKLALDAKIHGRAGTPNKGSRNGECGTWRISAFSHFVRQC